jgi:glycosyltransferase involved in cell wall biosynthesis
MTPPPWLSVIVPTYNGAAYLAQALDGIVSQRDPAIEVIAIDDGSTDGTVALLRHYAARLPLRIIQRGRIGNWVANSDHALRQATGEYACFLHQDDFWYEGRLAALRACVERLPDAVLWLHPVWFVDARGRRLNRWTCPLPVRAGGLSAEMVLEHLLVQNFVGMPAPLFRRETFLSTAGMDAGLWYVADWDLWLSLAERGATGYLPQPLAAFRVHKESQTVQRGRDLVNLRDEHQQVFTRHFSAWTCRDQRLRMRVKAAFEASTEINLFLMGRLQGHSGGLDDVLLHTIRLGPLGWRRLWRDSCIGQRLIARLRSRLRGNY